MDHASELVLDAAQIDFVCGGVSISAASCRADGLPSLMRAVGCRVAADRRTLNVLLAATPGAGVLDDVRQSGAVAVVFSQPSTHRTLQIKGRDARVVPPEAGDAELAARYRDAFVDELRPLGYPEHVIRTVLGWPADDLVVLQFTAHALFVQTPGPRAGEALAEGGVGGGAGSAGSGGAR
ncbi:MAG: hypothetical protein BGO63_04440 [Candidatus Accumulibacter sp. 66-26]|nr:hypothetical protein [Accumulibacter sp.]OJW48381.1 MAG: hypothetical protein BGO63_04440 [Candidatus Accumulibacter sp. 66-26]